MSLRQKNNREFITTDCIELKIVSIECSRNSLYLPNVVDFFQRIFCLDSKQLNLVGLQFFKVATFAVAQCFSFVNLTA